MPPKKSTVLAAIDSAFPPGAVAKPRNSKTKIVVSDDDTVQLPPSPTKRGRKPKVVKTPSVVHTSDDEPLVAPPKSVRSASAKVGLDVTKKKVKPTYPVSEILELSDASSVEADDIGDRSSAVDDEQEGDDCEFEEDDDEDEGVPISEDVGSDLADFIVDDEAEEEEEEEEERSQDDENENEIVKLAPGDSMYIDPSSPTNVRVKRPAPITPPLATRRAKAAQLASPAESPQASPTKKRRIAPPSVSEQPVSNKKSAAAAANLFNKSADAPARPAKTSGSSVAKAKAKVTKKGATAAPDPAPIDVDAMRPSSPLTDLSDDLPEVVTLTPATKAAKKNSSKATATKTLSSGGDNVSAPDAARKMESASAVTPKKVSEPVVLDASLPGPESSVSLHDDKYMYYVKSMPTVCEVDVPAFHDPKLKAKGFYKNLPMLKRVDIVPLRTSTTCGPIKFSSWPTIFPQGGLSISMVEKALSFVRSGRYINASRISPDELSGRPVYTSGSRVELCTGGRATAIFVSPCLIRDSYLHRYHPSLSFAGHYVTGLLHVLELDRLISAFGMVINEDALLMQIWADALTFGTGSKSTSSKTDEKDDSKLQGAFNLDASPTKPRAPKNDSVAVEPIPYGQKIPVYDARMHEFTFDKNTFQNLGKRYNEFKGEIPQNSCAIVGYIAQLQKGSPWRLHLYATWIILLGAQEPEKEQ